MARFLEKRRLPISPTLFGTPISVREPAKRQDGAAGFHKAPRSPATRPPGKNERKRLAVDAAIRSLGVYALIEMPQKAREQKIGELAKPQLGGLIPSLTDQNRWAHPRIPMDMMRQGWSMSLFQASQQKSTICW